jgi:hypothetical protein
MGRLVVVLVMVVSSSARADAPSAVEEKSPELAVSLSIGVTAAGLGALFIPNDGARLAGVVGVTLGPSVGRWYAGDGSAAGLGYRLLGTGILVLALVSDIERACDDLAPCTGPSATTTGLLVVGAGLWIGGAVIDVARGHEAATASKRRHALSFTPTALSTPSSRVPGLALTGQF